MATETATQGVKTILYPVRDLAKAKTLFNTLLGTQPTSDAPYYVGYEVGGMQIGLVPNGHDTGMTGPLPYVHVTDIEARLQALIDAGGETVQAIKDVGGGRRVASVRDADGNQLGLIQDPA